MKLIKKIAALLLTAAMLVTVLPVAVSAENMFKEAKNIDSGKKVSFSLARDEYKFYKITPAKSGTATVKITSDANTVYFYVYDEDGSDVEVKSDITSGRRNSFNTETYYQNSKTGIFKATMSFSVKAGETYYMKVDAARSSGQTEAEFELTFKYPTADSSSSTSSEAFMTLTMKKGDTLQLGANGENAKWTSSDKTVASVSSKGLVTAKKAGSAVITVKCGSKSQTIEIIVI